MRRFYRLFVVFVIVFSGTVLVPYAAFPSEQVKWQFFSAMYDLDTDLEVSKSDLLDPVLVGNILTYTIIVTNKGPDDATGVTITDTLPSNVAFGMVTSSQGSCSGSGTVICSLGSLNLNASATVTIAVAPTATGLIANMASVTGNETDPILSNNEVTEYTLVNPATDLRVSKSDSPDPVTVGNRLTYTVTVTNDGPSAATGVTLVDTLPGNVSLDSATPSQGNCSGTSTVNCSLGPLANSASATVVIAVTPTANGTLTNTASVTGNEADSILSNNEVTEYTLVNLATDLRVSKSDSPDPVTVGNRLTYTVTVTNDGPSAATGVTLVDTLPGNVSLDSATPSQGNCSGTSTVNCSLGPLANSASATVIIAVTPTTTETLTNTVSVSGNETDPDTLDNTTEEGTTVKDVVVADLSVSKSDSPDPVMVGGRLTYTVVITNNGPSTATGVTLIDTLPGNVFFGSATPSQGNCDGTSTMNCDLGTLNDGAVAMVTVVVNPTTAGIVTNTVSVTSNETDSNMDDNLDISVTTSESPSCPRSLEDVQISGPDSGYINAIYVFHSVITPSDATLPITYTWTPEPDSEQGMSNVAYQWISSGVYTLALVAENCPPSSVVTVSDTHTITISATPSTGDAYEPDDTCEQAQSILTDGTIQIHTFHDSDDEDWISFQATQGVTYVIQARVPAASSADIVAELYSDCSGVVRPGEDPPFSPDIRLIVRFPADGTYHLHFLNHDSGVYGPDVEYNVSVRALNPTVNPGALVIVAGRLYDDDALDLQENIQNVSNAVYRLFRSKSYPPERIYYLATDLNIDANGDHVPDVNALASKTNLEYAITQWTMDKGLGPDRALTLYFMDHGGEYGTFYLDNPRGERVTALALAGWLDQVETNAPGVKINVIFEACYSGGFIGGLQSSPWPGQSRWAAPSQLADWSHVLRAVSSPDRVVIASTEAFALAYASPDGAWFSDTFLGALAQDMSLAEAFQEGADAALQVNPAQIAWIDGDGDGWPNEQADYQEAAQRGFAFAGSFADDKWPAYISYAEVRNLDEGRGEIWAEVHDDQEVAEVRAIVYPPSYQPPTSGDQLVPSPLPVNLFSQGNNQYGVLYTSFDEMGEYRIVVYAKDNEGLQARPREVLVRTGWLVYLPAVLKD